jgi:uncharacterized membrane protein SpoIIM required for sporulation
MTEHLFLQRRQKSWDAFETIVSGNKKALFDAASLFPDKLRELTGDLNTAKVHGFDPAIIERLNYLVLEGNQLLYGQRTGTLRTFTDFLLYSFPRAVRRSRYSFGAIFLLFFGLVLFTALLSLRFPDLRDSIIPVYEQAEYEDMYNPENEHYLKPREVENDADMFGFYIYNNVSIAFRMFAFGILLGIGSLLTMCFNAVMIGGVAACVIDAGFAETFFSFTSGHSPFELTGIVLSAQAGLLMGFRLFVTQGRTRTESLRVAGKTALPLISGATLLLFIAAILEAFWSSRHEITPMVHYTVGIALWILLALYFLFAGREKRQ